LAWVPSTRHPPGALIFKILESTTNLKTISIQLHGDQPSVKLLKMILEAVSRTPNIRTTISIKINRHDPKLDVLALLEIVQRSVKSIEIDMNDFFNQFQTTDVQLSFYSLSDYNALEQFRLLGDQCTRKEVDCKTLLPESIRQGNKCTPSTVENKTLWVKSLSIQDQKGGGCGV